MGHAFTMEIMMPRTTNERSPSGVRRLHLRHVGITAKTRNRYQNALRCFLAYLKAMSVALPHTLSLLDHYVSEYINECWQEGEPLGYAGDLICGLQRFYPACRRQLPTAKQYFNNWGRCHVATRAKPLPKRVLMAMASAAVGANRYDLAALLLLGFSCFLRTAEILGIHAQHIHLSDDNKLIILALPMTKTSRRKNRMESVHVDDPVIATVVRRALHRAPLGPIFTQGPQVFRREFKELLHGLDIHDELLLPYSLRRGGATWHFLKYRSLDATVVRGRWRHAATARIYIEDAAARLVGVQLSSVSNSMISVLNARWRAFQ